MIAHVSSLKRVQHESRTLSISVKQIVQHVEQQWFEHSLHWLMLYLKMLITEEFIQITECTVKYCFS